jgi:hypothetical protein
MKDLELKLGMKKLGINGKLDSDGELEMYIEHPALSHTGYDSSYAWVDRDTAIKISGHLSAIFGISPNELNKSIKDSIGD